MASLFLLCPMQTSPGPAKACKENFTIFFFMTTHEIKATTNSSSNFKVRSWINKLIPIWWFLYCRGSGKFFLGTNFGQVGKKHFHAAMDPPPSVHLLLWRVLWSGGGPGGCQMFDSGLDAEHAVGITESIRVLGLQILGLHHHHVQHDDRGL